MKDLSIVMSKTLSICEEKPANTLSLAANFILKVISAIPQGEERNKKTGRIL